MPKRPLVCDTTLLLYLQRINQIELLPALYGPIYVPEQVALELDMGRLLRSDTFDPRQCPWATVIPVSQSAINALPANLLGRGEQAVIAYATGQGKTIAGLDDLEARKLAESTGLQVVGILGVLLLAQKAALIPVVTPHLHRLREQGFHIASSLFTEIKQIAGEI